MAMRTFRILGFYVAVCVGGNAANAQRPPLLPTAADTTGCRTHLQPRFVDPVAVVREWVRRDSLGTRRLDPLAVVACPRQWDFGDNTHVAVNPRFALLWRRGDSAVVLLHYERIGGLDLERDSLSFASSPGIDTMRMVVVHTKVGWRLAPFEWVTVRSPAALLRWNSPMLSQDARDSLRAHLPRQAPR